MFPALLGQKWWGWLAASNFGRALLRLHTQVIDGVRCTDDSTLEELCGKGSTQFLLPCLLHCGSWQSAKKMTVLIRWSAPDSLLAVCGRSIAFLADGHPGLFSGFWVGGFR